MKKRMNELENQLKIQIEKISEMSSLANKKEAKLTNNINQYVKQINDLKSELELLNSTITNLTEEKENNTIKLTELIHENEQLKKTKNSTINNNNSNSNNNNEAQNKKYEDLIIKLKKNIVILNEEKKSLEEVIIKQEEKVNELSLKVDITTKEITEKEKELKESMEYNAKLTTTNDFHIKEIQKLKQSNSNNNNTNSFNNKNKDMMSIMNLQKEIQTIKKEIETKDNKISLLTMNNKILQGKVNKLSQTTKNGFNNDPKNNTNNKNNNNIINKDLKSSSIIASKNNDKILHKDKNKLYIIAKPKLGAHPPGVVNGRQNSTSIRVKNAFYKNKEDNFNNNESTNKSKYSNIPQKKPQKRNNSNINNIKRQNNMNSTNLNSININLNDINFMNNYKNGNNAQLSKILDMKYKEIESKYKKEINKEMKEDALFDDDEINNYDNIKEEIAMDNNNFEPIEIVSNMASQTLKPKKNNRNNEQSLNMSQEKEYQIIESYCLLSGDKDANNNDENSNGNISKNNAIKDDDSKIENNRVEDLHNDVKKILDEL